MKYNGVILKKFSVMHRYERVDSAVLAEILRHRLGDLAAFRDEVAGAA